MVTTSYSKAIFVLFCFFLFLQASPVNCQTYANQSNNDGNLSNCHCHNDVSNKSCPLKWKEVNRKENTAGSLPAMWSIN